ncbi:hypothetical protein J2W17_003191 [Pseudomonas lini]|uniref:DUF4145 domain-containing protein n=1 Tax=Pseudomonas lini TaxID=163011 RepID=UPI00277E9D65|nr:DUF4145 domain-containing protein [Pseudomonas lini]MDQ0124243.1 hypothetical protein [Pseudomonas lini]
MSRDYSPPVFEAERFHCPLSSCGAFAQMSWLRLNNEIYTAECASCNAKSIWRKTIRQNGLGFVNHGALLYPVATQAPHQHPDLPEHIQSDFEEARLICAQSPRAAAALLRLCVQKLCNHLLEKEGDINTQIGELVKKGLPVKVQKALDSVRVIGNESVHPGTMDLNDTPELALGLFRLVNLIVQNCVTDPNEADEIFDSLPANKLKGIENRDKAPK